MTPEQWARLSRQSQAEYIRQFGPPPAGYGGAATLATPPAILPRQRSRMPLWIVLGVVAVLAIVGISIAGRGATTASDSCVGAGCSATVSPQHPATALPAPSVVVPAPAAPPSPPKATSARDWAKIAKDPAAHIGEAIIVYGQVKQFDSATGTDSFRANVDGVKHAVSYGYADYETNTFLQGGGADLSDIVEGDLFRAEAVVAGAVSYETTLGGTTTVPKLTVTTIAVIGNAK